jgi:CheY-like chemotaxis protein
MEKVVPQNILLVDDDRTFLSLLASELRECTSNFCILTAENGIAALKILDSAPVDLVVTDLKMPVMDGLGLISQMKKSYPAIPVFVMSFYLDPAVEARLREMGVAQSIEKTSVGALEEMIKRHWSDGMLTYRLG